MLNRSVLFPYIPVQGADVTFVRYSIHDKKKNQKNKKQLP